MKKIAIGTDARLSNDMLNTAITSGLLSTGCDVVDVGLVPTPTLQYTVKEKDFDSGVIITASHNPPHFNGIKGVASDGTEFSKDVEEAIEKIYFEKNFSLANWGDVGKHSTWDGSIDLYINGILSTVDIDLIRKQQFHVVLDCGNGAGCVVTPILLEKLGWNFKIGDDVEKKYLFGPIKMWSSPWNKSPLNFKKIYSRLDYKTGISISYFPGFYLCNYLYFWALYLSKKQYPVIFIHIPDTGDRSEIVNRFKKIVGIITELYLMRDSDV